MRKLLIALVVLLGLYPVNAASVDLFVDCRDGSRLELGYSASDSVPVVSRVEWAGSVELDGMPPDHLAEGNHHHVFAVILHDGGEAFWSVEGAGVYASIIIRADADMPECAEDDHGTGMPDGGIFEITLPIVGVPGENVCTWEIRNHGNPTVWDPIDGSTGVEVYAGVTFCRLPLGNDNLDHDPANYRATVVHYQPE